MNPMVSNFDGTIILTGGSKHNNGTQSLTPLFEIKDLYIFKVTVLCLQY